MSMFLASTTTQKKTYITYIYIRFVMERQIQPVHLSVSDFLFIFCLQTLFLLGMEKTKKDEEKSGDSVLRKKMKIQVISPFK